MIETIPDWAILTMIAIAGTVYRHASGYLKAKKEDPTIQYDIYHADATIISCIFVIAAYATAGDSLTFDPATAIAALLSGLGFQETITGGMKILPTPGTKNK